MKVRENRTAKQRRDLAKSAATTIPPPAGPKFDYAERAVLARQAHRAVDEAVKVRSDREKGLAIWEQAVERFHQAIDEAYPSGFWEKMHRLRDGDLDAVEEAIRFLEADPYFFRSGYSKQWLLRRVKRAPLSSIQAERLRQVVLDRVDRRAGREFREYARLARVLDSPELRSALESRLESPDPKIVHRTRHVLAVCDNDGAFFRSRFTW